MIYSPLHNSGPKMNMLSRFKTGMFIYNYLRNIYDLPCRDHLADENILWGFRSADAQTCIVNTSLCDDADIEPNAVIDSVQHRQTTSIKLITAVFYPRTETWKGLGFELNVRKLVWQYNLSQKTQTKNISGFQLKPLKTQSELSDFFASKNNHNFIIPDESLNNLMLLVNHSIMAVEVIYHADSEPPLGYMTLFPLKGFTVLELTLSSSESANTNMVIQMVETVVKNKEINRGRLFIITTLNPEKALMEKFVTVGEIQYYQKEKIKRTLRPVPACAMNAVLKTKSEYQRSIDMINFLGLPKHDDLPKNWDSLAALSQIVNDTSISKRSAILDAGGEYYSAILHQLAAYGYTNLHCVNLAFKSSHQVKHISYLPGDVTKTTFNDDMFSAITCLSVIEHIESIDEFFREMKRILKSDGILFISTDYWKDEIDTGDKRSYGSPLKIFDSDGIMSLIKVAKRFNLELIKPVDLSCKNKVVSCDGFQYTFLYLTFRKF